MKQIIVLLILMNFHYSWSQTITGRITDLDDLPIQNCRVVTQNAEFHSNENGEFRIPFSQNLDTITFEFVGYSPVSFIKSGRIDYSKKLVIIKLVEDLTILSFKIKRTEKSRYSNGQLAYKVKYRKGVKDGKASFYYPNGKLKLHGSYKNDLRVNKWQYYDQEGEENILLFEKGYQIIKEKTLDNN